MKRFNYFKYWYIDFLRCLDAKTHRSKVCYKNKKRHTEDNSPKYRMVGKMIRHPELDSVAINVDNRLRNKCAMTCDLFPRPFGERVRERGYLVAFTLAEVLITLGIIGVVAAMTMPSLIANYQKKQTVTQLKKAYSELSQALKMSETEYGTMDSWDFSHFESQDERMNDFTSRYLIPNLKILKTCVPSSSECWADNILALNKKLIHSYLINGIHASFVTVSGYSVYYWPDDTGVWFLIDINGLKKPNIVGRDIFRFRLGIDDGNNAKNYALNPYGADRKLYYKNDLINGNSNGGCNKDNSSIYAGDTCAALIMYNNWEITKDYPW